MADPHSMEVGRDLSHLSPEELNAWRARRWEDDRIYIAWRREWEPDYQHPWPVPALAEVAEELVSA